MIRFGAAPPTAAVSVEPIWSETGPGMIAHAAMRRACTKKGAISCISVPISPSIRITLIGSTITLMMPLSSVSTKPSCATTLTSASLALVPTASRMSCRLPARQISCSKRCASAACDDAPAPVSRKAAGGARSPAEELSSVLRRLGSGTCSTVSSYASAAAAVAVVAAAAAAAAVAATPASICVPAASLGSHRTVGHPRLAPTSDHWTTAVRRRFQLAEADVGQIIFTPKPFSTLCPSPSPSPSAPAAFPSPSPSAPSACRGRRARRSPCPPSARRRGRSRSSSASTARP